MRDPIEIWNEANSLNPCKTQEEFGIAFPDKIKKFAKAIEKEVRAEYEAKAEREEVTIDRQGRPMQGGYYMTGCPFCGNPYCRSCK